MGAVAGPTVPASSTPFQVISPLAGAGGGSGAAAVDGAGIAGFSSLGDAVEGAPIGALDDAPGVLPENAIATTIRTNTAELPIAASRMAMALSRAHGHRRRRGDVERQRLHELGHVRGGPLRLDDDGREPDRGSPT